MFSKRGAEHADSVAAARPTSGKWIVVDACNGLGAAIGEELRSLGRVCVHIDLDAEPETAHDLRIESAISAVTRALDRGAPSHADGVIFVAGLRQGVATTDAVRRNTAELLRLAQSLVGGDARLVIVTTNSRDVGNGQPLEVTHAPLWGLGQVVTEEHPELRCLRIDLDAAPTRADLQELATLVTEPSDEDQVAIRDGRVLAPRLIRFTPVARAAENATNEPGQCSEIVIGRPGDIASVGLQSCDEPTLHAGEVKVEVVAAGLGFRDVLNAVGMRNDQVPLGSEFAGRIVQVGEGVDGLAVGDRVLGLTEGAFRRYVATPATWSARLPHSIRYEDAAALPSAYVTAAYALERVGKLRRGAKLLIHAAAGGVGLAAIRVAQRAGAEIYSTAGNGEKRAFLKALGVVNVYDSRSLDFAEQIRAAVPSGIDFVLNTLSGDFVDKSLGLLAPDGTFIEVGKSDIRSPSDIERHYPGVRYAVVDMVEVCRREPRLIRVILEEICAAIESGELTELPQRTFPVGHASDAFRFMARAKHIGKIVLSWPARADHAARAVQIRPDATYLVTGAFGGLGVLTVRWLVERGARHLVLLGRSPPGPEAAAALQELERSGATIVSVRGDVADRTRLAEILSAFDPRYPLRGVIHAAGQLDDGVLTKQSIAKFDRVYAAKVTGSWNLHELTRDRPLDFFVLFSSTASLLGSPGQSNHAAANAFLDALATDRRRAGLPGLSINWGPWSVVGAAASLGARGERRFEEHGLGRIAPVEGIQILDTLLLGEPTAPQIGVVPIDWSRYVAKSAGGVGRPPRFLSRLIDAEPSFEREPSPVGIVGGLAERLAAASPAERLEVLTQHVKTRTATVLGLDRAQPFDERRPLSDMGLDSLMAVELRNLLGADIGRGQSLPATLIFKYPTVQALAEYLLSEIVASVAAKDGAEAGATDLEEIESLSDAEARELLADELSSLAEFSGDDH
jgi:NADPH:quinone reductase-like Zn-dependent oxidoreductase